MAYTKACINWIKEYFKDNPDGKAIIGISGGKDSTIAAALCVEALGADRVVGVMMPNGVQRDLGDSYEVCEYLGIPSFTMNMEDAYEDILETISASLAVRGIEAPYSSVRSNTMIRTNLPARLRMTTLYAVAALYPNSRVVNTCNRSEDYVGYSTKYGDAAGDFSPLGELTVREVLEIGDELGLPEHLVHKAPSDGMCGKTDEDNLGFTYEQLDDHILGTQKISPEIEEKIERLHKATRHKYQPMPAFSPVLEALKDVVGLYEDTAKIEPQDYATGGLVNDINISGNVGSFTIDSLYHSAPNFDKVNQEAVAAVMQKIIDTAGCGLFKENRYGN